MYQHMTNTPRQTAVIFVFGLKMLYSRRLKMFYSLMHGKQQLFTVVLS